MLGLLVEFKELINCTIDLRQLVLFIFKLLRDVIQQISV